MHLCNTSDNNKDFIKSFVLLVSLGVYLNRPMPLLHVSHHALASHSAEHLLHNCYPGLALPSWNYSSFVAGPHWSPVWALAGRRATLVHLWWWPFGSPVLTPLRSNAYILSCYSFYMEFTPIRDSIQTWLISPCFDWERLQVGFWRCAI